MPDPLVFLPMIFFGSIVMINHWLLFKIWHWDTKTNQSQVTECSHWLFLWISCTWQYAINRFNTMINLWPQEWKVSSNGRFSSQWCCRATESGICAAVWPRHKTHQCLETQDKKQSEEGWRSATMGQRTAGDKSQAVLQPNGSQFNDMGILAGRTRKFEAG